MERNQPTTPAQPVTGHPWDYCDGSCDCHIGICRDCGCTSEREAATPDVSAPQALDVDRLARALIDSDLMPRYMEYARLSPSMSRSETVEHTAERWAATLAAEYARLSEPTDG